MKLHVGCGDVILPGWVNLDLENLPGIDIQDDIRELRKIQDGTCEIIYASHVLEHVGRDEFEDVLKVWNKKLKIGGILRLAVPDFEKAVQWYLKYGKILDVTGLVSGGQKTKYDYHHMIFDRKFLSEVLEKCGFKDVHEWDWRKVEHGKFDDYSQSYLPHMEKENGLLMSLNLECIKSSETSFEKLNLGKSPWRNN